MIWWARSGSGQNELSGGLLGSFGGRAAEVLKMSFLGGPWGD